ncbi:hypothetical protein ABZ634_22595, partial [Nocardiopsis alba]
MAPANPHRRARRRDVGWLTASLVTVPLIPLSVIASAAPAMATEHATNELVDELRSDIDAILEDPALEGATGRVFHPSSRNRAMVCSMMRTSGPSSASSR